MRVSILFTLLVALLLTACAGEQATATPVPPTEPAPSATPSEPRSIRLMSHDSFAVSEAVIAEFEADNHAQVELLPSGDTAIGPISTGSRKASI